MFINSLLFSLVFIIYWLLDQNFLAWPALAIYTLTFAFNLVISSKIQLTTPQRYTLGFSAFFLGFYLYACLVELDHIYNFIHAHLGISGLAYTLALLPAATIIHRIFNEKTSETIVLGFIFGSGISVIATDLLFH